MIRSADFVGIDDICRRTFATQNFLLGRIFANITTLSKRKCGRVVECTGLENRRRLTPFVSSNLTASAKNFSRRFSLRFLFFREKKTADISADGQSLTRRNFLRSAEVFVLRENDVVEEVNQYGCTSNTHDDFQDLFELFIIHRWLSLLGSGGSKFLYDCSDALNEFVSFASCDIKRRHDTDDDSCGHREKYKKQQTESKKQK